MQESQNTTQTEEQVDLRSYFVEQEQIEETKVETKVETQTKASFDPLQHFDLSYLRKSISDTLPSQIKVKIETFVSELQKPVINIKKLKELSYLGIPDDCRGLRSLIWKVLIGYLPADRSQWKTVLQTNKQNYNLLCEQQLIQKELPPQELMKNENLINDLTRQDQKEQHASQASLASVVTDEGGQVASVDKKPEIIFEIVKDNPLNQNPNSKWKSFFQDQVFWEEIEKDTIRTRAEMNFFVAWTQRPVVYAIPFRTSTQNDKKQRKAQQKVFSVVETHFDVLTRLLFIYGKLNKQIKYVQGMNEILAPIYFEFCQHPPPQFFEFIESDSYFCFTLIMTDVQDGFIRECDEYQNGIKFRINQFDQLLNKLDPELWEHFSNLGVNPHFYSLRWLMLMLTQDFPLTTVLRLWDTILCHDNKVEYLNYLCVAILQIKREELLDDQFSVVMEGLQKIDELDPVEIIINAHNLYQNQLIPEKPKKQQKESQIKKQLNTAIDQVSNMFSQFKF